MMRCSSSLSKNIYVVKNLKLEIDAFVLKSPFVFLSNISNSFKLFNLMVTLTLLLSIRNIGKANPGFLLK